MPQQEGALSGGCVPFQRTFQKFWKVLGPIAGITDTGQQLILPLSTRLLSQLPMPGYGPSTVNPRHMPRPLPLIVLDGCAGLERP